MDTEEVQECIGQNLQKYQLAKIVKSQGGGNAASNYMIQIGNDLERSPFFALGKKYHTGNYFELAKLLNADLKQQLAGMCDVLELETRNLHWVDLLQSENSDVQFVVAGTMHAFYNTGVLMLLKENGWEIEHVDLDIPDFSQTFKSDFLNFALKYQQQSTDNTDSGAMELLTVISSFVMLLLF